jgi:hypothetical protein
MFQNPEIAIACADGDVIGDCEIDASDPVEGQVGLTLLGVHGGGGSAKAERVNFGLDGGEADGRSANPTPEASASAEAPAAVRIWRRVSRGRRLS